MFIIFNTIQEYLNNWKLNISANNRATEDITVAKLSSGYALGDGIVKVVFPPPMVYIMCTKILLWLYLAEHLIICFNCNLVNGHGRNPSYMSQWIKFTQSAKLPLKNQNPAKVPSSGENSFFIIPIISDVMYIHVPIFMKIGEI